MSRKLLVTIHLYLATFLTSVVLMMAISGGLYLFNVKGEITTSEVFAGKVDGFNSQASDLDTEVRNLFRQINLQADFEYLKGAGASIYTRPFSKTYYSIKSDKDKILVEQQSPDFVRTLVELHKGHGPLWFKNLQKLTAIGLVLILLSGFYLALVTPSMRRNALIVSASGLLLTLLLAVL